MFRFVEERREYAVDDVDMDDAELEGDIVTPGEVIAEASQWMRGHGTYLDPDGERIRASVAGEVQRTNKLISVKNIRGRYNPQVGDLVIGRIVEVAARRWKVDIQSHLLASLQLSAINLPGGVQRRKVESDELQMRQFFQEGDLLVAEVQSIHNDGAVALHTRSLRYGKLKNGISLKLPPSLIPRSKTHYHTLAQYGTDVIIGANGFVFVCKSMSNIAADTEREGFIEEINEHIYSGENDEINASTRKIISDLSHILSTLANKSIPITIDSILEAYQPST